MLTWITLAMAIAAFVLCVLGFDRPRLWHYLSCGFGMGLIAAGCILSLLPKVPLSRRMRVCGVIAPILLVFIDWTHWPLLASVYVCPPWAEMIADRAASRGPTGLGGAPVSIEFRQGRVLSQGNVGFQMIGGDGGGIYLVRRAGPIALGHDRVWYNTNWERRLRGEWFLVYED